MFIRVAVPSPLGDLIDTPLAGSPVIPAVDVLENEQETVVIAETPGVSKEDISVTFEGDVLTFSGERKAAQVPDNARMLMQEHHDRSFSRSLRILHDVERSTISASLENGLLRIVLPKAEAAKPRVIEVR